LQTHSVTFNIGGKIIKMESACPLICKEPALHKPERYSHFLSTTGKQPDIRIIVKVVAKLPVKAGRNLFTVYHFAGGAENWRWLKTRNGYIYKSPLEHKRQIAEVSRDFSRVKIYLLPYEGKYVWDYRNIVYDFLQILLINHLAFRKEGVILHAMAVKDLDGKGMVCAGRSGSGKSTMARLWHNNTKAMVLNDDRTIVRKSTKGFIVYGSPWHGEFSDYLEAHPDQAPLQTVFIIEHAGRNFIQKLNREEAFNLLYPALIPIFWDQALINNVVTVCETLIRRVPCLRLGFTKDKKVINFIRRVS
jgi:hypothetical protein